VRTLSQDGVKINLTAIFSADQVAKAMQALAGGAPACVSVFAGRLADFGIDYAPLMRDAVAQARSTENVEIIWASTREVYNVIEADKMGCHIITAPDSVISKLGGLGKDPMQNSQDTVIAFYKDAQAAGFDIPV
jgi:transaldolase